GDLNSASEGRGFGQPYGAALAPPGENLTSDIFNRAIGRVMANTDVLFSDLMRREVVMKKVLTVNAGSGPVSTIDLGATEKIFVGLSAAATKEDLAHLFFLIDTETKQVSQCRVTGVTNSGTAANLLGADQTVVPATAITSIENGSLVRCPAGNFLGSGVLPGDYATISGAGNLQPFSNN